MRTVVEQGQNIIDVCIQCYGSLEYLFELVKGNNWQGVNTNLSNGDAVTYRQLSSTEEAFSIQTFYANREIRVRTGEEFYVPSSSCGLPQGYMMGQFTIQNLRETEVYFLDINGIFPPPNNPNQYGTDAATYYSFVGKFNLSPYQAAAEFANWINGASYWHTQGVYAIAIANTVRLYVPNTLCECNSYFRLTGFLQNKNRRESENQFEDVATIPDVLYYDSTEYGTVWCCDFIYSQQNIDAFAENNWMITT